MQPFDPTITPHQAQFSTGPGGSGPLGPDGQRGARPHAKVRALAGALLLLVGLLLPAASASAQTSDRAKAAGIIAPGDAVVTGFSGIKAPDAAVPPGSDPLDVFHIDLDGPSAQVFRLGATVAPPQGQLLAPPELYKARARDVGQVFPIALDDSPVPNVYLGQSSAFGLQIVGADGDGDDRPRRLRKGAPTAQWMPGQFGANGGPGSIYKIDGLTGAISVFATIPGNGGAGLGDVVFDKASRHFFVSDLDTGLIHRLDAGGRIVESFDHGTAGRKAAGLAPVVDDGAQADIKDARFSVENPESWGLTPGPRRVWGMAVHEGRLYYAVADGPTIWSVGIGADGAFGGDARMELEVENTPAGHEVSDIAFDGRGRMYLAQRGAIRGSYDYSVFAEPGKSVVRRYRRKATEDAAAPPTWEPVPEEYAIGFAADHRSTAGGIALGYAYDKTGAIRRGSCGGTLWTTGDALRNDEKLAAKLGDEGPLDVHGLQGNDVGLVRPQNEPPFQSYFVDYDGRFGDAGKAGHVGDVEIWQPCEGSPGFTDLYPGYPPPGYVETDDGTPPPPPDRRRSNLKIDKKRLFCWAIGGGKHRCVFRITVTNMGPDTYHGHIKVEDKIQDVPGVTASFSSMKFACGGVAPTYTCATNAVEHLQKFEQVAIVVRVDVPNRLAKALHCRVRNHARITFAPGGTSRNTDPTDDTDSAVAQLPKHLCEEPPPLNTNLSVHVSKSPSTCPADGPWCRWFNVAVKNTGPGDFGGQIKVLSIPPPGVTVSFNGNGQWACNNASKVCQGNFVVPKNTFTQSFRVHLSGDKNVAKALNCMVKLTAKIVDPLGPPKNTLMPDDTDSETWGLPPELCITPVPSQCPPGYRWNGDRCGPIVGYIPPPPPPPTGDCPPGTRGRYPHCHGVTHVCPPGTVGRYPHCRRRVCPPGTHGRYPNCRRVVTHACPRGMVGRPPHCRPRGHYHRHHHLRRDFRSHRQHRVHQFLRRRR